MKRRKSSSTSGFFRRYLLLAGMTGTAAEIASELRRVYDLDMLRIPTDKLVRPPRPRRPRARRPAPILPEFQESARIDRQLFGRSARQSKPGSVEPERQSPRPPSQVAGIVSSATAERYNGGIRALPASDVSDQGDACLNS